MQHFSIIRIANLDNIDILITLFQLCRVLKENVKKMCLNMSCMSLVSEK